jgi:1,6-anhydro-N-acetylmuramate kinase
MVPPVQVTAVLASTRKFDAAADSSTLERETCGAELMGAVGSLHAAESRAANATRAVAANLGGVSARTRCIGKLRAYI